ncbi:class I SAM-dependent DNA methyltransferase [Actinacidiphila sp. bgisy167]|uniref:class I SAM-dependent DNA methyltransferase n=1 Tax=Actinacidiphila sp. bgisy167 TaxID=3413797 RepID=UPI003D70B5ED
MGVGGYEDIQLDRTGQAFRTIGDRHDEALLREDGRVAAGRRLLARLPAGSRVLDLGCGTGLPTCRQMAEAGHEVTGVDLSAGALALARRHVPRAAFHQAGIADLWTGGRLGAGGPHDLGRFDAVVAFSSLVTLPRAELAQALRGVHDLLRPGGLFGLSMVEGDGDDVAIPFLGHIIRVSGYPRADVRQVVTDAGFVILEEDSYAYAPPATGVLPERQLFLHCRRPA